MINLRDIFDNLEHSADKWNTYFDIYEKHLNSFVGKEITLVEVGVQKGGSLEMWSKYLGPQATIIGIDIDPSCSLLQYKQNNIRVEIGDQADPAFWRDFLSRYPKIDILIDDGGHSTLQQITTLMATFNRISVPGIFICEDCHTSYNSHFINTDESFIQFSKSCIELLYTDWADREEKDKIEEILKFGYNNMSMDKQLTSMSFYDSVVVFEKFGKKEMNRVAPKAYYVDPKLYGDK